MLSPQFIVINDFQCLIERDGIIAAIVHQAAWGGFREIGDKILAPHLHWIHIQFVRDHIHEPLNRVRRFRASCAAIGIRGHFIGKHRNLLVLNRLGVIGTGHENQAQARNRRGQQLQVSTHIAVAFTLDGEQGAIIFDGGVKILHQATSVNGRGKMLAPLLNPLHRAAQLMRHIGHNQLFGIELNLGAKPAPDIRRNHLYPVFRQADRPRQQGAQQMRHLGGCPHRQFVAAAVKIRQYPTGLHVHRHQALLGNFEAHHLVRLLEQLIGDAERRGRGFRGRAKNAEHDIRAEFFVNHRRIRLCRHFRVHHRWQDVNVHLNQIERVLRRRCRLGHDHGDRLPHKSNFADRQGMIHRDIHARTGRTAGDGPDFAEQILAGQHGHHAGMAFRG